MLVFCGRILETTRQRRLTTRGRLALRSGGRSLQNICDKGLKSIRSIVGMVLYVVVLIGRAEHKHKWWRHSYF